MEKLIKTIIHYLLLIIIFLLPLFFLTTTADFFSINKLYLLIFGVNLLLFLSLINLLVSKKISWQNKPLDKYLIFFLATIGLSTLISSPNKIQALLNINFGFVTIFYLVIFYFYFSRLSPLITQLFNYLITLLSLITIIFFFDPFKNINLPNQLVFLKDKIFTPVGTQLDLAIILGFFLIFSIVKIIKKQQFNNLTIKQLIPDYFLLNLNLIALLIALYNIFKPINNQPNIIFPPFNISWFSAVEILKNPLTALFGVGIDNYSTIFTKVKDIAYNQSNLWQINSFNYSRSTLLHIMTEAGVLGLISFLMIVFQVIKENLKEKSSLFIILYSLLIIIFLPPTFILWFVFFLSLMIVNHKSVINHVSTTNKNQLDLSEFPAIYGGIFILGFGFIIFTSYLLGRNYLSEVYFKNSLDAISKNDLKSIYDNQRQATILNPYLEKYYINLSQTTLLIANNLVQNSLKTTTSEAKLKEEDKQTISQAIQQAISFAKDGAVRLNPQKGANWQNLGEIYKNIIGFAQQADLFAISSYQRAIILDPQNPIYRLNLGGIYYILGKYDDAINLFTQTAALKPEWPNAHYNLAWSYYQKEKYQEAVASMENVLRLIDPKKDKADYDKAKRELEEFKKKLPKEEEKQTSENSSNQPKLSLPSPVPTGEKPIELPNQAKP